jgi:putative aldouronate transport system substrate-binding protein
MDDMPNYSAILSSDPDFYAACVQDDGSIGGLFGFYEEGYPPNGGAWIRQDYLNEIGYEGVPTTYDELYEVLTKFKTELGLPAAITFPYCANWQGNYLSAGYDIATNVGKSTMSPFFQIDGTVYYGYAEDACYDYVSMLNKWYSEGLVYADFVAVEMPIMTASQIDDIGCGFAGLGNVSQYAEQTNCENYALTALPAMKLTEDQVTHFTDSQSRLINEATIITTECADPELACKYYDYWYSEEGSILLNYGVEGESWEYNEDGEPQLLESIFDNSNTTDQNLMLNAKQRGSFVVAWDRTFFSYNEAQMNALEVWGACDDAYDLPAVLALSTEEQSVVSAKYTDIETAVLENLAKFITGDRPMSEWSSFVSTLYDMGLDEVIAAYQSAFDRYNARAAEAA